MRYPPSASSRVEPAERPPGKHALPPTPAVVRASRYPIDLFIGSWLSQRGCSERSNSFIRQVDFARYDRPGTSLKRSLIHSA